MKIGIDLDEVILDYLSEIIKFYNTKNNKSIKKEQFNSYNFWEVWGGTREEAIQICDNFHNSEDFHNFKSIPGALDALNILNKGNEIFIITSRSLLWKEKTEKWIKDNINFSSPTIFSSDIYSKQGKTKLNICKEFNIPILLEDNANYSLECANAGIKVILFDKPWNKRAEHPNIIRVNNWYDAMHSIEQFKNTLS